MAQSRIPAHNLFNREFNQTAVMKLGSENKIGVKFCFKIKDDDNLKNESNVTCNGTSITVQALFSHQNPISAQLTAPANLIQKYIDGYKQDKSRWLEYGKTEAAISRQLEWIGFQDEDETLINALVKALREIRKTREKLEGEMQNMVNGKYPTETIWYIIIVPMRENEMDRAFDDERPSSDDDDEDPNKPNGNGERSEVVSTEIIEAGDNQIPQMQENMIRNNQQMKPPRRRPSPPPSPPPYLVTADDEKYPALPREMHRDQREGIESSTESRSEMASDESVSHDGERYMTSVVQRTIDGWPQCKQLQSMDYGMDMSQLGAGQNQNDNQDNEEEPPNGSTDEGYEISLNR